MLAVLVAPKNNFTTTTRFEVWFLTVSPIQSWKHLVDLSRFPINSREVCGLLQNYLMYAGHVLCKFPAGSGVGVLWTTSRRCAEIIRDWYVSMYVAWCVWTRLHGHRYTNNPGMHPERKCILRHTWEPPGSVLDIGYLRGWSTVPNPGYFSFCGRPKGLLQRHLVCMHCTQKQPVKNG